MLRKCFAQLLRVKRLAAATDGWFTHSKALTRHETHGRAQPGEVVGSVCVRVIEAAAVALLRVLHAGVWHWQRLGHCHIRAVASSSSVAVLGHLWFIMV